MRSVAPAALQGFEAGSLLGSLVTGCLWGGLYWGFRHRIMEGNGNYYLGFRVLGFVGSRVWLLMGNRGI